MRMISKWLILSSITTMTVLSACNSAIAQAFRPYYRVAIHRFEVNWNGKIREKSKSDFIGRLGWEVPKKFVDKGYYEVWFLGTEKGGVYYAERHLPGKKIEAYGFGEEFLEVKVAEGFKISYKNSIDFSQPYIFRKVGSTSFEVESYTETTEIVKFFEVLNQWLYRKVIPYSRGEPYEHLMFDKTDYEMGNGIGFRVVKSRLWTVSVTSSKK